MSEIGRQGVMQCGREITVEEIEQIRQTVELLPGLAVNELAATICEHLEWYTAGGGLKVDACLMLLEPQDRLENTWGDRRQKFHFSKRHRVHLRPQRTEETDRACSCL